MLDKSSVNEAMRHLKEVSTGAGHAAGGSRSAKQASQLASDVKYKAAQRMGAKWRVMSDSEKLKIYLQILASSPAPGNVKNEAKKKLLAKKTKKEEITKSFNNFISEGDAAYDSVLKSLKAKHGDNAVLGTGETIKDTRSEKSKVKAQRKRAASDEKERRFKKRNPAVTSGRYPKDDEKAWAAAREREKREGVSEGLGGGDGGLGAMTAKRLRKKPRNEAQIKALNPNEPSNQHEGKLVHGPFGPYITGQKLPKEHKETPLVKVPYENFHSTSKKVAESIKINQATPKSPNCIVMPAKDDISDKSKTKAKTTKTVVTKKQKQLLNQEHVTLEGMSKVAESLGGTVISLTEQGKSNWRGELNSPNAVKKYALDEEPISMTIGGIALWKLLAGGAALTALGTHTHQKLQGKRGILDWPSSWNLGGKSNTSMDNIQWRDPVNTNKKVDTNVKKVDTNVKKIDTNVKKIDTNVSKIDTTDIGNITGTKKNTDVNVNAGGKGKVKTANDANTLSLEKGLSKGVSAISSVASQPTRSSSHTIADPIPKVDTSASDAGTAVAGGKGKVVDIPKTKDIPIVKPVTAVKTDATALSTAAVQSKTSKRKISGLRLPGLPKFNTTHNVGTTKNPT